jgi:hypothetical protein
MTPLLFAFFSLWAKPCVPMFAPVAVYEDVAWAYHVHSAWACDHLYQVVESIYRPHGETLNIVPLLDGERVWNAPNPWLSVQP